MWVMSATPQPGIFAIGTRSHRHLEFDVDPTAADADLIGALDALREPNVAGGASNMVIGFGADLWRRLSDDPPADLGDFQVVDGRDGLSAPATQHDIWVWVHGTGDDVLFDATTEITKVFAPVATLAHETDCFVYHDSRDLTGFIDGSANPPPSEAPAQACVPAGSPGAGGTHVIVQKWVHDLAAFHALDVADQEDVFGRRKADSESIPKPQRPANAHISLAEIHDADGEELEIYRRSTPWGSVGEKGLLFLGFSQERDRFVRMLDQIFGTDGREIRDRLLDFTTPVSGSFYFAPSLDELVALGLGDA